MFMWHLMLSVHDCSLVATLINALTQFVTYQHIHSFITVFVAFSASSQLHYHICCFVTILMFSLPYLWLFIKNLVRVYLASLPNSRNYSMLFLCSVPHFQIYVVMYFTLFNLLHKTMYSKQPHYEHQWTKLINHCNAFKT